MFAQKIWTIARNTFREASRNRILHAVLFASFVLVLSSIAIGQLSVENNARVIRDTGTTFISLAVVFVSIFSGVSLLQVELQRKTIYTIVTKPVSRWVFIVGKFFGLLLTIASVLGLLAFVFFLVVFFRSDPVALVLFQNFILVFAEGVILASIALFFSSFSTPVLSGLFSFAVFVLGRLQDSLERFSEALSSKQPAVSWLMKGAGVILPDLSLHRADLEVAYTIPLTWSYVAYTCLYSVLYASVCIALSALIFSRRDFV